MKCDPISFMGAVMTCARLGLEPGGPMGHVYLIPYENKRLRKFEVQVILGYRGMIALARNSGQIISINANCVYENDRFDYELGLKETLVHKPSLNDRGKMIGVYAIAHLMGGGHQIGFMSKFEVDEHRKKYAQDSSKPWNDNYDEMAKKTIIRRIWKYLPMSTEMSNAVTVNDASEKGSFSAEHVLEGELEDGLIYDMDTGEITSEVDTSSQADELAKSLGG